MAEINLGDLTAGGEVRNLTAHERGVAARLTPLSKALAFMHMADQAFNYDVHGRRGFELLAQAVTGSACFEFQYGTLEQAVVAFDDVARRA